VAITVPWPSPIVVASLATTSGGSSIVDDVVAVSRAAVEKEPMDATMLKSATDDVAMAERVAVDKKVTDTATTKKVTDDAAVAERATTDKRATEVAMMKKVADDTMAVERATTEVATLGVAESPPALVVGAKRTAVWGGSTHPAKRRFHGSWKPRYVERSCSCFFSLYAYFVSL
jgi:hypothetical protein